MNPDLPKLESFVRLLHELEKVKRHARRPDEREQTSTAEHTLEVAMLCWYVASVNKLDINFEKVLKYALAHDLIEAYAGDTPVYGAEGRKTKEAREHAAFERIKEEFAEFPDLLHTIETYEKRADPESNFVYAADKLIDPLNISMEQKQSLWKESNISLDMVMDYKQEKVAKHPTILAYWQELVKKLESKKDFFFHA